MIRHRCPNCEEVIPSPDELAGMPILCPYCRAPHVEVPRQTPPDLLPRQRKVVVSTEPEPLEPYQPGKALAGQPRSALRWLGPLGIAILAFAAALLGNIQMSALVEQWSAARGGGLFGALYRNFGRHLPVLTFAALGALALVWAVVRFLEHVTGNED